MAALLRQTAFLSRKVAQNKVGITVVCGYKRKFRRLIPIREDEEGLPSKAAARSALESLADRGFCRPQKAYQPPDDVHNRVKAIYEDVLGCTAAESWMETPITDPLVKYKLLTKCIKEFGHDLPNSCLMRVRQVDDLVEYYSTAVEGVTPFDSLVRSENTLPPNIHAIPNYVRFHPETDTFFGGVNAYPGTSTIVTGLKAKKKFKGHISKSSWPFE
ncbi:uncharacterized protein LOC115332206 [Ixodes scapularis]|uniref:uncharacterized protein LOC115332206 n=1 Tax=Ixodes scapularis TaxID=6945 RepID=UPI001A9E6CF7|nr:uncharacterized protein LOC115332206 [Ixodes scapularis]